MAAARSATRAHQLADGFNILRSSGRSRGAARLHRLSIWDRRRAWRSPRERRGRADHRVSVRTGLATPMSIMVAQAGARRWGVLVNAEALERLEQVDTLVIDKTGTLTEGKPAVSRLRV